MIGVLALQGGFLAHRHILGALGVETREVRLPQHLEGLSGLIMPGGESTAMLKLMDAYSLFEPLAAFGQSGRPVLGTCAGAILMARRVAGLGQRSFGWIPVEIERNAYGSQRESFQVKVDCPAWGLESVPVLFIRAPRFTELGPETTVLSEWEGSVTGVIHRQFTAVAYHPELGEDTRFHAAWLARNFERQGAVACASC